MNEVTTISVSKQTFMMESTTFKNVSYKNHSAQCKTISGLQKTLWLFVIRCSLFGILLKAYKSPLNWYLGLRYLIQLRKKFLGNFKLKKMVKVDGKYYIGLYTPGYFDDNYRRFITSELNYFKPIKGAGLRFNHVHLAITHKCALQCDHCYTWDTLNQKDQLDEEDLLKVISRLQNMGTGQIHLTGGEPLLKINLLINLLNKANKNSNIWINTSGYRLTFSKAKQLKKAGLTGIFISLDHFDEEMHNSFRGFKHAYHWALEGAKNAIANNMVVAFSVCITNDFVSEENLMKYMLLAKNIGVHFVQYLEPKPVGHFEGRDVKLSDDNLKILESFFVKMNYSNDFLDFPIISYHGYYQRRQGCFAGGNRSVYIDAKGNLNACNFCHTNSGNILSKDFNLALANLSKKGCSIY
ncbi:radical SAM protein [Tamlana fucoidanivorans]|uniref:Radical SAM protein n=1 Tax=Allotamlana fucoidanivorans TaxID=2583814 RepID=A0A5C4SLX7_9FLAO|nr:radical SAM protein [Tamlana fucoidanivorans]TNJ44679.1 radical SAM protein [Tamlana fucoidanivorans]